jgi:hypothetical protein
MRKARRLRLLESAVAGLVDRLEELERANSDRESALRDARERQQQRLNELKQTMTTHKRDLAGLTNTPAPADTRPDLHLVPALETHAEAR